MLRKFFSYANTIDKEKNTLLVIMFVKSILFVQLTALSLCHARFQRLRCLPTVKVIESYRFPW